MLAVQVFKERQSEANVIKELLANYADVNRHEQKLGITPLIMAIHLNNEPDAVQVT
jgi:ankyrin repeat protein